MSRPITPFKLSASARSSLKAMVNSGVHSARKLNRARILLLLDQGLGPKAIHEALGVSKPGVWVVRKKCEAWGWEAAVEGKKPPGAPPRISGKAKAQITALACSDPPEGHGQWSLRLLADRAVELGYVEAVSHEKVREILKKECPQAALETVLVPGQN